MFATKRPSLDELSKHRKTRVPVPVLERPAVGTRVDHPVHGEGVVVELMEDGRTRVEFDNGESHRYHMQSMEKLADELPWQVTHETQTDGNGATKNFIRVGVVPSFI